MALYWLSLGSEQGAALCCGVRASYCSGFSRGARALGCAASVVAACARAQAQ